MQPKGIIFATNGTPEETVILLDGKKVETCQKFYSRVTSDMLVPLYNLQLYGCLKSRSVVGETHPHLEDLDKHYKLVFCGYDNILYLNQEVVGRVTSLDIEASTSLVKVHVETKSDLVKVPLECKDWLTISH